MDHQDFKPVVLRKNKSPLKPKPIPSKHINDPDIVPPKLFTKEFGQKLASQRNTKGMTQKDLSLKLNVKEAMINSLENGKLLYDGNLLHRLKKLFPDL